MSKIDKALAYGLASKAKHEEDHLKQFIKAMKKESRMGITRKGHSEEVIVELGPK